MSPVTASFYWFSYSATAGQISSLWRHAHKCEVACCWYLLGNLTCETKQPCWWSLWNITKQNSFVHSVPEFTYINYLGRNFKHFLRFYERRWYCKTTGVVVALNWGWRPGIKCSFYKSLVTTLGLSCGCKRTWGGGDLTQEVYKPMTGWNEMRRDEWHAMLSTPSHLAGLAIAARLGQ